MQSYNNKEKQPLFYLNLILLFLIFAIGIIIAAYLYYNNYEKQYRTEFENQLNAIADLKTGKSCSGGKSGLETGVYFIKTNCFLTMSNAILKTKRYRCRKKELKHGWNKFR